MDESNGTFPDDVPVADAVEQQRATDDSPFDDDDAPSELRENELPLEADASDWQEQRETVEIAPDLEDPNR
jgi:hypothetical protein